MKWVIQTLLFISAISVVNANETGKPSGLLTLNEYLAQVRLRHEGFVSAELSSQAAALREKESSLIFWPSFQAHSEWSYDDKNDSLMRTEFQKNQDYGVGLSEQTPWGLGMTLKYQWDKHRYEALGGATPPIEFARGRPSLEASLPLGRNFFGAELRAQVEAGASAARAQKYSQSFQMKFILAQAESAYWGLSSVRTLKEVSADVLKRSDELYRWAKNKEELQLADRSDRLQSEALLRLRQLDLKRVTTQWKDQGRLFNSLRGVENEEVTEELEGLKDETIEIPRKGQREDLLAHLEMQRAAEAQARAAFHKGLPTLEVYGGGALGATRDEMTQSLSSSWGTAESAAIVGLRLNIPLNISMLSKIRAAAKNDEAAALRSSQRKVFEENHDWHLLESDLKDAQERLGLHRTLESIQKEKVEAEQKQMRRARSTMFQVIQSELDYAEARVQRIRAQTEIKQIVAQMKMFGGSDESR